MLPHVPLDWALAATEFSTPTSIQRPDTLKKSSVSGPRPTFGDRPRDAPLTRAANENLRLQNLWDGIEFFAAFFSHLECAKN
jgi:hypothetical protein